MIDLNTIVSLLDDKKAEDIVVINLQNAFVDHMVVASASSHRQLVTLADTVTMYAKEHGVLPIVDGADQTDWIVVDVGFALVHLFKPDARTYYNIEKMWGKMAEDVKNIVASTEI